MDAVAFPPPPAPFLDDDFDFGDFTFAAAPASADPQRATFAAFDDDWGDFVASPLGSNPEAPAPPTPPTATSSSSSWEKPRGPLPLSLFGADDHEDGREEEGPAGPPPTATAHQTAPAFCSNGSRPADLKGLIAGLYGSQPPSATAKECTKEEAEDDAWEFKAAAASPAGRAHGDGIGKMEDTTKSLGCDQEDWSSFTSADENLNHVQTTDFTGTHDSTGEYVKASVYSPPAKNAVIFNLYKESELADAVHITQKPAESVHSSSDLFSSNEMKKTIRLDQQVLAF